MKLAEWSVKNSLLVNLLTVFVLVAGCFALFQLRREAFPNINLDIVQVTTRYPGATPGQIEKLISIPIEKELKELDDIKEMVSASAEGLSLIYLTIEPDAPDKPKIVNDIQRAVDRTEDLPADLEDKPIVEEITTRNIPVLEVSLYGELSPLDLRIQAKRLEDKLLDLPDVASSIRRGYREPEFSVEVDPKKMRDLHISLPDVLSALQRTNVNFPGGKLKLGDEEVILRVSGEFYHAPDIEQVIVRGNDRGYHVKIKDVAKVQPALEELVVTNRTDGFPSINLMVTKKSDGDIIELVDEVKGAVKDFLETAPPGLKVTVVNDLSFYVQRRLNVLFNNGILGLVFVVVPLVLFLSFRTALSAVLGIFTAVAATFALMQAFDITVNLLSLFGMIMVLGMLVDEDIVIAENIHRHMEEGLSAKEAAIVGASQVTKSVFATVLTTITAFMPLLLLMSGIMGKYVRQIPAVVILTLTASLLQAVLILPSHMAEFSNLSEAQAQEQYKTRKRGRLFETILRFYERTLRVLIRFRYWVTGLFLVSLVGVGALGFYKVPFILFPQRGIEQFFIRVEAPLGTSVEDTTARMEAVEKILQKNLSPQELDHFVSQGGIQQNDPHDPFTQRSSHKGQVWVFLTPESDRKRTADEIMEALRPEVESLPDFVQVSFDHVRAGPPVGKPVAIRLKGDDFQRINALADQYRKVLSNLPGVKDVKSDYERGKDELVAQIDEEKMSRAGLTYQDVATAVRVGFDGGVATTIKEGDEEIDVVVRFPPEIKTGREALDRLMISNLQGDLIPLSNIARFDRKESLALIKHDDRKRLVMVTANIDEQSTTSMAVNAKVHELMKDQLKKYPEIQVKYGGEEEDTQESLQSLGRAFVLALLLTFIIIAVTFRSLWEPFLILTTVPMGAMGVIIAFALDKEPLTFLALLGIVGFSGVVVDSAIILIDFINRERRERQLGHVEAIIVGSKMRLRAIFLTTVTTILGVVPAAFGIGGADPFIQPMAKAMNWGIGFGSFLALFLIPVFLAVCADFFSRWEKSESGV